MELEEITTASENGSLESIRSQDWGVKRWNRKCSLDNMFYLFALRTRTGILRTECKSLLNWVLGLLSFPSKKDYHIQGPTLSPLSLCHEWYRVCSKEYIPSSAKTSLLDNQRGTNGQVWHRSEFPSNEHLIIITSESLNRFIYIYL